jgi:hypothetical protein
MDCLFEYDNKATAQVTLILFVNSHNKSSSRFMPFLDTEESYPLPEVANIDFNSFSY